MSNTCFKINCWLINNTGNNFCIELHEQEDCFKLYKQEEIAGGRIHTIVEKGEVDQNKPHSEYDVDSRVVKEILDDLRLEKVSLVPDFTGGFDGTHQHMRIQNGDSIVHLSWWSRPSKEWSSVQRAWTRFAELAKECS